MRSFSYVLAAVVMTVLALGACPELIIRPLNRVVRQWIAIVPLCAVFTISDEDDVVCQRVIGRTAATLESAGQDCTIEVTARSGRFTIVAIAAVASPRRETPWRRPARVGHRGQFAVGTGHGEGRASLSDLTARLEEAAVPGSRLRQHPT